MKKVENRCPFMRKKILFLLPSLHGGGAERVMVTLLKNFDREKFDVSLALVAKEGTFLSEIPPEVKVYDLKAKRVRNTLVPLIKLIWKIRPDTILSTQGYLNLALIMIRFLLPKGLKIVVREGSIVSEKLPTIKYTWAWKFLYRKLYRKADLVVCQSKYMLKDLYDHFSVPADKLVQIYNPVDISDIRDKSNQGACPFPEKNDSINILSIGRLSHVKRHDRIIESMPQLLKIKPNAKLWILGTGELLNDLINKRDQLGLHDEVIFAGFQKNPYVWLKHANLMVLSSDYEGLPNVALEALACGCSVIAKDHPGGTKEIFEAIHQEERVVPHLHWQESWFDDINEDTMELFKEVFDVKAITKAYEKIVM